MKESKKLRRRLIVAALALLAALASITAATFSWYVYNTSARTTEVKMSAGSGITLQIANDKNGDYASATVMEDFKGKLCPVSTDKISGGFQQALFFDAMTQPDGQNRLYASIFDAGVEKVDYHKTSLFLRTNAVNVDIYLSDIGFEDLNDLHPLSTALRLGLVVKQKDADGNYPEFIFEVNPQPDPNRGDNADRVPDAGHVLDSTKTDGSTVAFVPLNSDNFCQYDPATGAASRKPNSKKLFTLSGNGTGDYGEPMEVEVYLWLEGCDLDCTLNLSTHTLKKLSLSFAGIKAEGG